MLSLKLTICLPLVDQVAVDDLFCLLRPHEDVEAHLIVARHEVESRLCSLVL